jgi:hypothetical protein
MRIEPVLMPPAAVGPAQPAGAPASAFAEILGWGSDPLTIDLGQTGADPAEAAAAETLLMQPASEHRDQERSLRAFAFGVFGLFPLGLDQGAVREAEGSAALSAAPAAGGASPGADSVAQAVGAGQPASGLPGLVAWTVPASVPAGETAGPLANTDAGAAIAPPRDAAIGAQVGRAISPAALEPAPDEPAAGAPTRPQKSPPPPRADPTSLVLVDQDGRLSVIAGAAGLGQADYGAVRARLRDAAASVGATLGDIQLNGLTGPAPATGGDRHGRGAR